MHMYSAEHRLIGGQAIVGAQLVIATGVGFAIQYQEQSDVALALFGDGAVDEGAFHESLNLAALWKLPVVFLCENNQYSMGMAVTKAWSVSSLEPRAAAYGMPYASVDGMDVLAVREAMLRGGAERARMGEGPTLIESVTYRFRGHSLADPAHYRTREEEAPGGHTRPHRALRGEAERGWPHHRRRDPRHRRARRRRSSRRRRTFAEESPDPRPRRAL